MSAAIEKALQAKTSCFLNTVYGAGALNELLVGVLATSQLSVVSSTTFKCLCIVGCKNFPCIVTHPTWRSTENFELFIL